MIYRSKTAAIVFAVIAFGLAAMIAFVYVPESSWLVKVGTFAFAAVLWATPPRSR
jgi:hypothetical protein